MCPAAEKVRTCCPRRRSNPHQSRTLTCSSLKSPTKQRNSPTPASDLDRRSPWCVPGSEIARSAMRSSVVSCRGSTSSTSLSHEKQPKPKRHNWRDSRDCQYRQRTNERDVSSRPLFDVLTFRSSASAGKMNAASDTLFDGIAVDEVSHPPQWCRGSHVCSARRSLQPSRGIVGEQLAGGKGSMVVRHGARETDRGAATLLVTGLAIRAGSGNLPSS